MLKIPVLFLSACLYMMNVNAQVKKQTPLHVIFDTDMATDYDDVGAITLLHYYADKGKVKILATIASTKYPRVAAVLSVLNTYFKRPDIPVGVPTGAASQDADSQKWSDSITTKYPHNIKSNDQVMDAVQLYRKILSRQPDNSVTLITVGFYTNIVNLLKSGPDKYSPLSGQQLVNKKILKLISMAGKFPSGYEYNMGNDSLASKFVFTHWTKPVVFSGFEIGEKIHTGIPLIHNNKIKNDPVKDVFNISIPKSKDDINGRMSWDETAVMVAVNGPAPWFKIEYGHVVVNADGSNGWASGGNQGYLVFDRSPKEIEQQINHLMMHQPK